MNDETIERNVRQKGLQATLNDNDLFVDFIKIHQDDWLTRCPSILSELMEEFNNDWVEYVEGLNEPIEWEDLDQAEQESLTLEKFPIHHRARIYLPAWWIRLEDKGLVKITQTDKHNTIIDLTDGGRSIIPDDFEDDE